MGFEDVKSSAHVWGGNQDPSDSPPAYSGQLLEDESPEQTAAAATPASTVAVRRSTPRRPTTARTPYDPLRKLATLSNVQFHRYNVPDGTVSPDKVSLTVKHSDLYSHPQHLLPFVLEQAHLPPKPTLRIVGAHYGTRVDFDITINLTNLLDVGNHRWRFNSAQVTPMQSGSQVTYVGDDPGVSARIASGVRQFCKDRSENKSYHLTRTVEGLPTEMLAGQVRNLAASVKYRGLIRIDFVFERSNVIVHKQPSNWFSNMLGLHLEKKFEMVETVWTLGNGSEEDTDSTPADVSLRAAQEWWQSWASTIRNAIIVKHRGNLGIEDWIEAKMGRIEAEPRVDWGGDHTLG